MAWICNCVSDSEQRQLVLVAFDGFPHSELKNGFYPGLKENQQSFSKLDLSNWEERITHELFTTLITGESPEEHEITGAAKKRILFEEMRSLPGPLSYPFDKTQGLREAISERLNSTNKGFYKYEPEDIKTETIFDKFDNAAHSYWPVLNIPYDHFEFTLRVFEHDKFREVYNHIEMVFEHQKRQFWKDYDPEADVFLVHFQNPDALHHYTDEEVDRDRRKEAYWKCNEFAEQVKDELDADIIFMSDHGLPSGYETGHEDDGFVSMSWKSGINRPSIRDINKLIVTRLNGS